MSRWQKLKVRMAATSSRPIVRLAAVLVVLAIVVTTVWLSTDADRFDAWVPDLVLGLLTLAATITIVEGVIQREARRQIEADRERHYLATMSALCDDVVSFGQTVAENYRIHYPDPATDPVPASVLELFQLAVRDDRPPPRRLVDGKVPETVFMAGHLATRLDRYRMLDREHLSQQVISAIDGFSNQVAHAREGMSPDPDSMREAETKVLYAASMLALAIKQTAEHGPLVFPPLTKLVAGEDPQEFGQVFMETINEPEGFFSRMSPTWQGRDHKAG